MSPDDARSLGELLTFVALGGYTAVKARKAAKQTVATGNGFARFVKESLVRLEAQGRRTEQKIDLHIQSHADADVHRGRVSHDIPDL